MGSETDGCTELVGFVLACWLIYWAIKIGVFLMLFAVAFIAKEGCGI